MNAYMQHTECRMIARVVIGLVVIGFSTAPLAQSVKEMAAQKISVDDPRPLASAVRELESRHGWIITYEDVALANPDEISDVTSTVRRDLSTRSPRVLIPRGGPFEFWYSPPRSGKLDIANTLSALLISYQQSGHPGVFQILRDGPISHVVPRQRRSVGGSLEARGSILETRITIAPGHRTALQMVEAIRDELTRRTGTTVLIGTVPITLLSNAEVTESAAAEPARLVLQRTLTATNWPLSWQLFYQPGSTPLYGLNIHAVGRPVASDR